MFCSRTGNPGQVSWAREMPGECQDLPGVGSLHKRSCQAVGPRVIGGCSLLLQRQPWGAWATRSTMTRESKWCGTSAREVHTARGSLFEGQTFHGPRAMGETWSTYNPVTGHQSVTICTAQGHFCSPRSDLQLIPSAGLSGWRITARIDGAKSPEGTAAFDLRWVPTILLWWPGRMTCAKTFLLGQGHMEDLQVAELQEEVRRL